MIARAQDAAAGHFEMAGGVGGFHPVPRVMQPGVTIGFGHEGEPGDLVPAPDEGRAARRARIVTAKIIELHEVGQMFAGPAAGGDPAFAAQENGVSVTDLEDSLVWMVGHTHDAEGEGVKIKQ